jgi:hypothetical protein
MRKEDTVLAKARERQRRYLASIQAHPRSPREFDDLLLYIEDAILDLKELCAIRGIDFERSAKTYIDGVVNDWRAMKTSKTSAERLRGILTRIVKVNS